MKKRLNIVSLGIALFTMLFGAGNIVFPLILGRETGSHISTAMLGFIITAVLIPILGLTSAILFEGNYKKFLGNIGSLPSLILIFICMFFIIGPFGATTRCLILSYNALKYYMPSVPIYAYVAAMLIPIYFFCYKENRVVDILGTVLGPMKISLLVAIIIIGLAHLAGFQPVSITPTESMFSGLKTGYLTLDLIGTIFFAHLIYDAMKTKFDEIMRPKTIIWHCMQAGLICAVMLGLIYYGFGMLSASYSQELKGVANAQMLSMLSIKVLGQGVGILTNITVAVSMIATATALITLFSDYLAFNLFKGRIKYRNALFLTMAAVLVMSNLDFDGIMKLIGPIAMAIYPALIVLSIGNILNKLTNFKEKYIITLVWITFVATIGYQLIA